MEIIDVKDLAKVIYHLAQNKEAFAEWLRNRPSNWHSRESSACACTVAQWLYDTAKTLRPDVSVGVYGNAIDVLVGAALDPEADYDDADNDWEAIKTPEWMLLFNQRLAEHLEGREPKHASVSDCLQVLGMLS